MDDTIPEHVEGTIGDPDHELGDDAAIHTELGSQLGDGDEREEGDDDYCSEVDEISKTSEEIREEEVNELENFSFPDTPEPEEDPSGRLAYKKKCEEFDFYLFPVNSVVQKFDLEVLSLAHAGLGDKGAIALAESLKVNSRIHDLCVLDNWITPRGGQALLEAIKQNDSITKLDLSENRLGYRAGQVDHHTIGETLRDVLLENKTLKAISLRSNKFGDGDICQVASGLSENFSLHVMDMSYNELGPRAGEAIGTMLNSNGDLTELNLEWNQLRNEGTMFVLDGLKNNNTLKMVSIAWNGVSDKGGVAVGEVLQTNTSLEEVDVSHNRIAGVGAARIAQGIAENATIRRLILANNPLGDEGCAKVVTAIGDNQSLVFVDLKSTESGHEAATAIMETYTKREGTVEIHIPRSAFVPGRAGGRRRTLVPS
uniref:Uncharacterized protein n=1 Tax=Eutreptiella gymnastica TaxID=73025 RepID=A0A7S1IV46_9EUGL|mmetsp:Transcript_4502/g.7984  ORF Transcript_4502/g.7984 Transcript_4502/m.7984 type:complete len:427 (+) Transcript_4502:62-1342(+)